jgi:hypothetical protein
MYSKVKRGREVGKTFGYHKPFLKLALKPAPTWKKLTPFVGEQKWLVPHLTFDLLEGAKNMPKT